jgi:hypothetical protein
LGGLRQFRYFNEKIVKRNRCGGEGLAGMPGVEIGLYLD